MTQFPAFWLEPTDQTRVDRIREVSDCDCGDLSCGTMVTRSLFRRADTGELVTLQEAPPGAMWDATWFNDDPAYTGADGISLVVRTPGGTWMVDSRCGNCGLPEDDVHKCWVRHGDPRLPGQIHVDKAGVTCPAGAGSIQCGSYHGFLHHGVLREDADF